MAAPASLLALNAGSSSLKAELFVSAGRWRGELRVVVEGIGRDRAVLKVSGQAPAEIAGALDHRAAAELVLREAERAVKPDGSGWLATAHRVVHGGRDFAAPVRVAAGVLERLDALTALAPLHNPPALDVLRAVCDRLDGVPAVAVFDTAFFRSLPAISRTYAVPASWRSEHGIERYGFHGVAHEYLARRCAARGGARAPRLVTLQLGNGCSAAALRDGHPIDTSMGFTPLEGLVMGTRSGDVDAGVLLHVARTGTPWRELDAALNRRSGLLGLSERSADMSELLELDARGDARAALAVDVFCYRARKYIGAYAAALGGLDAVAFGGGIGEHAAAVRRRICGGLEWLGLELDEAANAAAADGERLISSPTSRVAVHVIPVREEPLIARHACECLGAAYDGLEV
jgi:acetate kinase